MGGNGAPQIHPCIVGFDDNPYLIDSSKDPRPEGGALVWRL